MFIIMAYIPGAVKRAGRIFLHAIIRFPGPPPMQTTDRISFTLTASQILAGLSFIVLALSVLVQANPATRLPGRDNGFYLYIGEQIVHGKLPYRDAWESKPPAIFYLNALA